MAVSSERKNRAARRLEERETARLEQAERDSDTLIATTPSPVTATDGLGVERIIGETYDYTPAQTDPDPNEVKRLANLQAKLEEQKQDRLNQLTQVDQGGAKTAQSAISAEGGSSTSSTSDSGEKKPAASKLP